MRTQLATHAARAQMRKGSRLGLNAAARRRLGVKCAIEHDVAPPLHINESERQFDSAVIRREEACLLRDPDVS